MRFRVDSALRDRPTRAELSWGEAAAGLHAVTLDGAPQPSLQFAFYEHPHTGLKGMIAYIPLDSLAHGRHVIGVMPAPPTELPTDSKELAKASWKQPLLIPFWR